MAVRYIHQHYHHPFFRGVRRLERKAENSVTSTRTSTSTNKGDEKSKSVLKVQLKTKAHMQNLSVNDSMRVIKHFKEKMGIGLWYGFHCPGEDYKDLKMTGEFAY